MSTPETTPTTPVTVRAKFEVHSITYYGDPNDEHTMRQYELGAVYDTTTEENRRFSLYTPYAELKVRVDNPNVHWAYGEPFYVDFIPASLPQRLKTPETMGNVHDTPTGRYEPGVRTVPEAEPGHPVTNYLDEARGYTGGRHAAVHGGYPDTAPTPVEATAPEAAPSSKGYTDPTTTQPMDPAEITAEDKPIPVGEWQ